MLLLLTAACAAGPRATAPVEPFSETFYASKDLNFRDLEKLQTINRNAPVEQSASAGLILGRHYIKKGQYDKGMQFLEKNYRETYLTRYMRYSGMVWLFDAYSKTGNDGKALEYYTMINNRKNEDPFPAILRSYCSSENVRTSGENPFDDCIETRFAMGKTLPPVTEQDKEGTVPEEEKPFIISPDEAAEPPVSMERTGALTDKVYLIGGSNMDFMQAAIVAIANKRAQLKLEMGDGFNFSSAKVDPFNRTVYLKSDIYNFDIDRNGIAQAAVAHLLKDKTVTVVAASNEYGELAEQAVQTLKANSVTTHVINFEKGSFENEMKAIGGRYDANTRISVIVLAPEVKLIRVVSLVRYSIKNPERVRLIIGTDCFGQRYLNEEYAGYFRRAFLFTPAFLAGNMEAAAFRETYMSHYGEEPSLTAYIANDIVSFLNGEPIVFSATGISNIEGDRAVRTVRGYRIMSISNIEPIGE